MYPSRWNVRLTEQFPTVTANFLRGLPVWWILRARLTDLGYVRPIRVSDIGFLARRWKGGSPSPRLLKIEKKNKVKNPAGKFLARFLSTEFMETRDSPRTMSVYKISITKIYKYFPSQWKKSLIVLYSSNLLLNYSTAYNYEHRIFYNFTSYVIQL